MKKQILVASFAIVSIIGLSLSSCKKDDTTGPTVTLSGSSSETISLNSSWSDPGATASDDEDGAVTPTSDASSSNPNVNHTGTYTITYTATDAAGNVGTAVRTVIVRNDAEDFAGTYLVIDSCAGLAPFPVYNQTITVDETTNNRVHFSRFADYTNNTGIYATKLANGKLEIPSQTTTDIGAGSDPCDVTPHRFESNSAAFIISGTNFAFGYTDQQLASGSCTGGTTSCFAAYTKQ